MVQVHYDEGIANHIGPEPCVVGREAGGEASAGGGIGQPLVRQAKLARSSRCKSGPGSPQRRARPAASRDMSAAIAPRKYSSSPRTIVFIKTGWRNRAAASASPA